MFTSYAQNFEDVLLWRALNNVTQGLYIDIGAQDPVIDSVSYAFYQSGWRGLNVEPTDQYAQRFRDLRPDDELIQRAVSDSNGSMDFYEVADTGLSTGNIDVATSYRQSGYSVADRKVDCVSLAALFDRLAGRDIHWLKVDVEGMEHRVLKSWRDHEQRPWIAVVESTRPNSDEPWFEHWEAELLDRGYEFCYFDGLNRFYVHNSHPELKQHFLSPPNVFDDFTLTEASLFSRTPQQQLTRYQAELETSLDGGPVLEKILRERNEEIQRLQIANNVLNERMLMASRNAKAEVEIANQQHNAVVQAQVAALIASVEQLQITSKAAGSAAQALKTLNRKEVERREDLQRQLEEVRLQLHREQEEKRAVDRERTGLRDKSVQMSHRVVQLEASESALKTGLHETRVKAQRLEGENAALAQIKDSTAWKMTYPFRRAVHVMRAGRPEAANGSPAVAGLSVQQCLLPISSYAGSHQVDQWRALLGHKTVGAEN